MIEWLVWLIQVSAPVVISAILVGVSWYFRRTLHREKMEHAAVIMGLEKRMAGIVCPQCFKTVPHRGEWCPVCDPPVTDNPTIKLLKAHYSVPLAALGAGGGAFAVPTTSTFKRCSSCGNNGTYDGRECPECGTQRYPQSQEIKKRGV